MVFLVFSNLLIAQSNSSFIIVTDEIEGKNKIEYIKYNNTFFSVGDTIYLDSTINNRTQSLIVKIDKKLYLCDLTNLELVDCIHYEINIIKKKWIENSKYSKVIVLCDGRNILSSLPMLKKEKHRKCHSK